MQFVSHSRLCSFEELLAVQHNGRDGMMFGVAKGDESRSDAALCREFLRWSREDQKRFAAWFFFDVDVAPAHCLPNAGAECFRHRFLRRKTGSQMARWKFHRHGISNFALSKYTMKEFFAETLKRALDSPAFDEIHPNAKDTH